MRFTNWSVITGAPCSGKTTIINELERAGYPVVHEVARACIDAEIRGGRSIEEIKADPLAFERRILMEKVTIEAALPEQAAVFLDRAVPDSIAYFQFEGLDPEECIRLSHAVRYRRIFFFEQLDFENDAVRAENPLSAQTIGNLIETSYLELNYDIIRVPVLPVDRRLQFVLDRVESL